jgi:hypothetical protein
MQRCGRSTLVDFRPISTTGTYRRATLAVDRGRGLHAPPVGPACLAARLDRRMEADAVYLTLRRDAQARRSTSVRFGMGPIREQTQCSLMQPRRDAVGCWPHLPITSNGAVERRLLGSTAVVDPGSDATRWRLVPDAATDLGFVQALLDDFQGRRGQRSRHRASVPPFCASAIQLGAGPHR